MRTWFWIYKTIHKYKSEFNEANRGIKDNLKDLRKELNGKSLYWLLFL